MKNGTVTERPQGGHLKRLSAWGGTCPPQKKMSIYLTSHHKVRTYCCGESIENTRITTMGRTWVGESQTMLSGSVVGAGYPNSRIVGMPRPLVQ